VKTIDFLPESYRKQRARRRRVIREAVLVVMITAVLGGYGVVLRAQGAALAARASDTEAQVVAAKHAQAEAQKLAAVHAELVDRRRVQRELAPPVPHTRLLAELGRHLPDGIAVRELNLTTRRPEPRPQLTAEAPRGRRSPARAGEQQDRVIIEMEALAPGGDQVADLVARLTGDPLFSDVRMRYSRQVVHEGVLAQLFKLDMHVELNRAFIVRDGEAGDGVDAVGPAVAAAETEGARHAD